MKNDIHNQGCPKSNNQPEDINSHPRKLESSGCDKTECTNKGDGK